MYCGNRKGKQLPMSLHFFVQFIYFWDYVFQISILTLAGSTGDRKVSADWEGKTTNPRMPKEQPKLPACLRGNTAAVQTCARVLLGCQHGGVRRFGSKSGLRPEGSARTRGDRCSPWVFWLRVVLPTIQLCLVVFFRRYSGLAWDLPDVSRGRL